MIYLGDKKTRATLSEVRKGRKERELYGNLSRIKNVRRKDRRATRGFRIRMEMETPISLRRLLGST